MKKEWIKLMLPPAIATLVGGLSSSQFVEWMATTSGIATLVPILVEFWKIKSNVAGKTWKIIFFKAKAARVVTWALSAILIVLSYFVGWGFQSIGVLELSVNVLVAGFIANRYYNYDSVQLWLAKITENIEKVKALIDKIEEKAKK